MTHNKGVVVLGKLSELKKNLRTQGFPKSTVPLLFFSPEPEYLWGNQFE